MTAAVIYGDTANRYGVVLKWWYRLWGSPISKARDGNMMRIFGGNVLDVNDWNYKKNMGSIKNCMMGFALLEYAMINVMFR